MNGPAQTSSAASLRWFRAGLLFWLGCDLAKHVLLLAAGPVQPWPDSALYWRLGQHAADGDWWLLRSAQAFRTPVYPWFLAACQTLGGARALWGLLLIQHGLEVATSCLAAATVFNVTRAPRATLWAYGFCVILTARTLFANTILTETWATFLFAVLIWLFSRMETAPGWGMLLGAAAVLGLQILIRPAAAAFVPALVWVAWHSPAPALQVRQRLSRVVVALGMCAAVVAPWCVRNALVWNRFTISVFAGRELWSANFSRWPGTHLSVPETGAGRTLRQRLGDQEVNLEHNWSVASALSRQGLNDVELDDLMKDAALQAMGDDWPKTAIRFGARCLTFWYVKDWELDEANYPSQTPWEDQIGWSSDARRQLLRRGLQFTPERFFQPMWLWSFFTWAGVGGLLIHPASRRFGVALAALMLGLTVLTAALEIPCYRYRCILEPAMVVACVAGIYAASRHFRPTS